MWAVVTVHLAFEELDCSFEGLGSFMRLPGGLTHRRRSLVRIPPIAGWGGVGGGHEEFTRSSVWRRVVVDE
jgi:hypothetical protein